mgnify:CR=1 FL=1
MAWRKMEEIKGAAIAFFRHACFRRVCLALPKHMQLSILNRQPPIARVVWVNVAQVDNLSHHALIGSLDRDTFRFTQPLDSWKDTGNTHHLIQELKEGHAPKETTEYQLLARMIAEGEAPKGLYRESDAVAYIHGIERLIADIRREGVRVPTQQDKGIQVVVDENGRLGKVWGGGTHRYGIAREFGLTSIPVYVRHAHADWLSGQIAGSRKPPLRAVEEALQRLGNTQD